MKASAGGIAILGIISTWAVFVIGWVLNIFQIILTPGSLVASSTWTALFLVKVIGIFVAPLGSILGLIGLFW